MKSFIKAIKEIVIEFAIMLIAAIALRIFDYYQIADVNSFAMGIICIGGGSMIYSYAKWVYRDFNDYLEQRALKKNFYVQSK